MSAMNIAHIDGIDPYRYLVADTKKLAKRMGSHKSIDQLL